MSAISKAAFVDLLKQSQVVPSRKLEAWLTASQLEKSETAAHLAKALVSDGLLTSWQAKFLLTGRHRLQVGNYVLLQPIRKDEYGDRFLAVHSSLARKVELQIFAGQVTGDANRRDELIQKTTRIAKLDHPALVHVYDFDYESRRYYLVVEHVEGEPLNLQDGAPRSAIDVASILVQAVEGLGFAHHHGVIHGSLIPQDLILSEDGSVKIQNLAMEFVRRPDGAEGSLRPEDDFQAVSGIGLKLMQSIPARESESNAPACQSLESILIRLRSEGVLVLPDLKAWIADHASLAKHTKRRTATSLGVGVGTESDAGGEFTEDQAISDAGWMARHWQEYPIHVIATAAVLLIGAALGITWLGYQWLGNGNAADISQNRSMGTGVGANSENSTGRGEAEPTDEEKQRIAERIRIEKAIDEIAKLPDEPATDPPQPKATEPANAAPAPAPAAVEVARSETPAAQAPVMAAPAAVDAGQPDPAGQVADAAPDNPLPAVEIPPAASSESEVSLAEVGNQAVLPAPVPVANGVPDNLTEISGVGDKTEVMLKAAGVNTFAQLASLEPDKLKQILRDAGRFGIQDQDCLAIINQAKALRPGGVEGGGAPAGADPPAAANGQPVADLSQPFANFPRRVALPALETTTEQKLADLVIRPQYLLGLEIICPDGIARTKAIFEAERTSEDNQAWVVGYRRTARQKSEPLARVRKTADALVFQWLPDAEKNRSAPYLQNCFLKLVTPDDQSTVLSLRQPQVIPALKLDPENLTASLELELPALPDLSCIQIDIEKFNDGQPDIDIVLPRITATEPGQILLKPRQKNGFMWVQVVGDVRSRIKIQANVVMMNAQMNTALITKPSVLDSTLAQLQQMKTVTALNYSQMNTNNAAKKDAQTEMNRAAEAVETMQVYMETLQRLLREPIRIRISGDFDGYQVLLAESDPEAVPVEAPKRP